MSQAETVTLELLNGDSVTGTIVEGFALGGRGIDAFESPEDSKLANGFVPNSIPPPSDNFLLDFRLMDDVAYPDYPAMQGL